MAWISFICPGFGQVADSGDTATQLQVPWTVRNFTAENLTALPRGYLLHRPVLRTLRITSHKPGCPARDGQLSQRSCWRCTHFAIQHGVVRRVATDVSKDLIASTVKVHSTIPATTHLKVRPRAQPNPQSVPFLRFLHCPGYSDGPTVGTWCTRKCAAAQNNSWTPGSLIWGHFVTGVWVTTYCCSFSCASPAYFRRTLVTLWAFYRHRSKHFGYGRARDVTKVPPALEKKRGVDGEFSVNWRQEVWGHCRMVAPGVCLKGSGLRGSWSRPRVAWN